jgi:hypothetical protein
MGVAGSRFTAVAMTLRQTSAGREPPVTPFMGRLSSRPIQTTVTIPPV